MVVITIIGRHIELCSFLKFDVSFIPLQILALLPTVPSFTCLSHIFIYFQLALQELSKAPSLHWN